MSRQDKVQLFEAPAYRTRSHKRRYSANINIIHTRMYTYIMCRYEIPTEQRYTCALTAGRLGSNLFVDIFIYFFFIKLCMDMK